MDQSGVNEQSFYVKYSCFLSQEESENSQVMSLDELGYLTNNLDQYLSTAQLTNHGILLTKLSGNIVTHGLVNIFDDTGERNFHENDFHGIAESGVKCFSFLKSLLPKLSYLNDAEKRLFLIHCLMLCATHNKKCMWSSDRATISCTDFLNELIAFMKCKDLSSLLCAEHFDPTIFRSILLKMKPQLTKDTWIKNPSSRHMFVWLLINVKHPFLSEYLPEILPPSLMFIDHYSPENKVLGIQSLDHIISNVPPSCLKLYGKSDVIYDALSHLTYFKDFHIVEWLYPCIIKLMPNERKCAPSSSLKLWNPYDEIYQRLLLNFEMENDVKLQSTYLCHINLYMEKLSPIKHFKHTIQILSKTILTYDGPEEICRIQSLKILKLMIKKSWPRMDLHCDEILKIIMFLVYDIKTGRGTPVIDVKDEVLNICMECLILLSNACPMKFDALTKDIVKENSEIPGMDILSSAINMKNHGDCSTYQ